MSEKRQRLSGNADDMLAAFLATYALAAFSYEKYMPESFMKIFRFIVFSAFAAVWLFLSFKSGRRGGKKFPIFAVLFWVLPQLVAYLADNGPEVFRMSIIMYVLSEFLMFLTADSTAVIGTAVGIPVSAAVTLTVLLCGAAYMAGLLVYTKKKGNYT
ncbi:MAG: hypothetical protein NC452_02010 [Eubacterium sp.]|nr:hypothetical protein [Eubacterium sp.]